MSKFHDNLTFSSQVTVVFKTMEKFEFRVLIKHCFLMGKNKVQTKQLLDKYNPDSAPPRQIVEKWSDFKRGRINTDDAERFDRPNSVVVQMIEHSTWA